MLGDIISRPVSAIVFMPGFLIGFFVITAIKLRKSPFDLSTSHHAHQELVKGLTTEMAGPTFGIMNVAEYYEMILMLGIVALFFLNEKLVELAAGHRDVPARVLPRNPVGQRERAREVAHHARQLLDRDAAFAGLNGLILMLIQ